jgi:hypothetical protein
MDALDIETFLLCKSAEEGKILAEALIAELNLPHGDIVFLEHHGPGARVRIRVYIHRPGNHYRWLDQGGKE